MICAPRLGGRPAQEAAEAHVLLVSNRAPIEHKLDESGTLHRAASSGGLATALGSCKRGLPFTWIASAVSAEDRIMSHALGSIRLNDDHQLRYVTPNENAYQLHYDNFCNPVLWFVQHGLSSQLSPLRTAESTEAAWRYGYIPVNQAFAGAIADELRERSPGTPVMLQDYHLYLTPRFLRNLGVEAPLQHFMHIPWPEPAAWNALPTIVVESICSGLLANDSVVFQTPAFARNFVDTCRGVLSGLRYEANGSLIEYRGRETRISANPISVDIRSLQEQLATPEARDYIDTLAPGPDEQTIVRVDRLDPSKNVLAGFHAFDQLLQTHTEWIGRVRFLAFLVPSRTNVPEYQAYADEVMALIELINTRHGRDGWQPVQLFHEHNRTQALAGLTHYDVLLANSLADGMNLVAKEGPAVNQRNGAVVLSTAAGCYEQLKDGALGVLPNDIAGTAEALHSALMLSPRERLQRAMALRQAVLREDLGRWFDRQFVDVETLQRPSKATFPRGGQGSRLSVVGR